MKLKVFVIILSGFFVFSTLAIDENSLYVLRKQNSFYENQILPYTNASLNSFEDFKESHIYLKQLAMLELKRELTDKADEKVIETM